MRVEVGDLDTGGLLKLGQLLGVGGDQTALSTVLLHKVARNGTALVKLEVTIGIINNVGHLAERLVLEEGGSLVFALGEIDGVKDIVDTNFLGDGSNATSASREGSSVKVDSHLDQELRGVCFIGGSRRWVLVKSSM